MPRTIDEGFRDFLSRLTPSSVESDKARNHRASIEACLKSNFNISRFFRTGSFGNGTSISGYSDVDYFASIPDEHITFSSDTILRKVRDALDGRFPATGVGVTCPAIVVPFGTDPSETTEVVPAKLARISGESPVYKIPDCSGDWLYSSPDAHSAYVREIDENLNGEVKPLVRFIKAWKYLQNVPISSFYLELRVAKYAEGESSIIYYIDIKRVFNELYKMKLARIYDPISISGYIDACSTEAKHDESYSKLTTALIRAEKALDAKGKDNIKDAFYWWNSLYGGQFSSYYK